MRLALEDKNAFVADPNAISWNCRPELGARQLRASHHPLPAVSSGRERIQVVFESGEKTPLISRFSRV
jgi:hypothetical protein